MSQSNRLSSGGLIDRDAEISFSFDGDRFAGYRGDTLASALLANGIRLVGRSFKYHRPRGIMTSGSEEPNALVELGEGARRDPNSRMTTTELFEGLTARSQNRFPSLRFDMMASNNWLSPFLGAGFYYKTFMWPAAFWEKIYEPLIRRAAGLGSLSGQADPDDYEKAWAHCDLLVVGSGPAGLQAALLAGRSGARVILCEEDFAFGGRLNCEQLEIALTPSAEWARKVIMELGAMKNVRLLNRTTIFGCYDGNTYGGLERVSDHLATPVAHQPRQRFWRIVAKRTILAAGAIERGIVFANNDRPGIMHASAVRSYVNRFAATPGKSVVVFTNNDDGWRTVRDLAAAKVPVEALVDIRPAEEATHVREMAGDTPVFSRSQVVGTQGHLGLTSVQIRNASGKEIDFDCDCLAVSGGWNPNVHLTCNQRGKPIWNDGVAAFVPGVDLPSGMRVAGAANGSFSTHGALAQGLEQARTALEELEISPKKLAVPDSEDAPYALTAFWHVADSKGRAWLDFQNDVTVKDIAQSHKEGFRSVEHLKRYTTLGMATDQGKIANVSTIAIHAAQTGQSIAETGTTIYRPPYTPVAISAFAGRAKGPDYQPTRLIPSHDWAKENSAVFTEAGLWLRPQWFPQAEEKNWRQSCDREARTVRKSVGVCDVSTLGKIDVRGRDAAKLLDRIYSNMMSTLAVGRVRYGLMLREDGFVMDDGTVARLGKNHFLITTTTANAGLVMQHVDFCAQVLWHELAVQAVSATDQFAQFAIAGPNSRAVLLNLLGSDTDLSNEAFPFMACGPVQIGDVQGWLYRISFSGELAYELAVPARYGDALIRAIMKAGSEFEIAPYGVEALNVLRIEKGHAAGGELNGQTTAGDLGLSKMVSAKKDCIGKVMADRPALIAEDRMVLTGFKPVDHEQALSAGAHFIAEGKEAKTEHDEGWMSSVCFSPALGHSIGLGFVRHGRQRFGEVIRAVDPIRKHDVPVEICSPHFVDPDGERQRV